MKAATLANGLMVCLSSAFLLISCSNPEAADYKDETPTLTVQDYFNGKLKSHGMAQDWDGKVAMRFTVDMLGEWRGNTGKLTENYSYQDGQRLSHVWDFRLIDPNHFVGTANDAVGELKGEQYGNVMHLRYRLHVPNATNTNTMVVYFDDWLYRIDEHVVLEKNMMRKFGLPLAKFTVSYYK